MNLGCLVSCVSLLAGAAQALADESGKVDLELPLAAQSSVIYDQHIDDDVASNVEGKGDLAMTIIMPAAYTPDEASAFVIEDDGAGPVRVVPNGESLAVVGTDGQVPAEEIMAAAKQNPNVAGCVPVALSRSEAQALVRSVAQASGADAKLITALAGQESQFDANVVSDKGAIGLMQLMPDTAAELGVDPCNPVENVRGGIAYYSQMLGSFDNNMVLALAGYNAGPGAVQKYDGVPPFSETTDYIAKVMTSYYAAPASPAFAANKPKAARKEMVGAKVATVNGGGDKGKQGWTSGFVLHVN